MTILSFFYFLYVVVMQIVGSCRFSAIGSNSKCVQIYCDITHSRNIFGSWAYSVTSV